MTQQSHSIPIHLDLSDERNVPSPSHNVSSSPSPNQPSFHPALTGVCNTTIEELMNEGLRRSIDSCPVCQFPRGRHSHLPNGSSIFSPQLTAQASLPGTHISSAASTTSSITAAFSGVRPKIPQWSRKKTCYQFLGELERALKISGIPNDQYYRAFALITDDPIAAEWIDLHIIDKELSFHDAKRVFTDHFELSSMETVLRAKYKKCHQLPNESVQQYADNFMNLCTRLGIHDDNQLAIDHFVEHLTPAIAREYQLEVGRYKAVHRRENKTLEFKSLHDAMDFAISLDSAIMSASLTERSSASSNDRRPRKPHKSSSSASRSSNSSSRSSNTSSRARKDDRSKRRSQPNSPSDDFDESVTCYNCYEPGHKSPNCPSSNQNEQRSTTEVTCYKCNKIGHYANECPSSSSERPSSSTSRRQSVSSSSSSWKSAPPTNAQSTSSSSQSRRSTRPSTKPNRYTPQIKAKLVSVHDDKDTHRSEGNESSDHDYHDESNSETESVASSREHDYQSDADYSDLNESTSCSAIRLHISSIQLTPELFHQPSQVILSINDRLYKSLIDTGASHSFIDTKIVEELQLPTTKQPGSIQLAQNDQVVPRLGTLSQPLLCKALFLSTAHNYSAIQLSHQFELMPLPNDQPFILGADILPDLVDGIIRGLIELTRCVIE
jgi:hypothetical protein